MSPVFPLNTTDKKITVMKILLIYRDYNPRSIIYPGKKTILPSKSNIFTFRTEDFAERLNFKIAPHFEFQVIAVIGIFVNFCFCYLWEVRLISYVYMIVF